MVSCSVSECGVTGRNNPQKYTFHRFPADSVLRDKWLRIIDRGSWIPKKSSTICSKHFEYKYFEQRKHRRVLKKDSIPTLSVPIKLKKRSPCSYVYRDIITPLLSEPSPGPSNQEDIVFCDLDNMPGRCPVPGCLNKKGNHRFPKSKEIRRLWIKAIRCSENMSINDGVRVCSAHFTEDDYQKISKFTGVKPQYRSLLKSAVPSIFPWNEQKIPENSSAGSQKTETLNKNEPVTPIYDLARLKMSENLSEHTDVQHETEECCVCLKKYEDVTQLFDIFQSWSPPWVGMQENVAADLAKIANITISELDKCSKYLCGMCYDRLNDAAQFAEEARQSYLYLKNKHKTLDDDLEKDVKKQWPQPIQIARNINGTIYENAMQVEIKQEEVSDDETDVCFDDSYMDTDIKIEPEEIIEPPSLQIKINETVSLGAFGTENADEASLTTDASFLITPDQPTEELILGDTLPRKNSIALVDISRLLAAPVKDEPLSENEEETTPELPMECMLCMKTFISVTGLKAHVIAQHSYKTVKRKIGSSPSPEKRANRFCCDICKRTFVTRTDLMVHETCHDKYSCYGCNSKFDTFETLTRHRKRCKAAAAGSVARPKTLDDVLRHRQPNSKESSPAPDSGNPTDNLAHALQQNDLSVRSPEANREQNECNEIINDNTKKTDEVLKDTNPVTIMTSQSESNKCTEAVNNAMINDKKQDCKGSIEPNLESHKQIVPSDVDRNDSSNGTPTDLSNILHNDISDNSQDDLSYENTKHWPENNDKKPLVTRRSDSSDKIQNDFSSKRHFNLITSEDNYSDNSETESLVTSQIQSNPVSTEKDDLDITHCESSVASQSGFSDTSNINENDSIHMKIHIGSEDSTKVVSRTGLTESIDNEIVLDKSEKENCSKKCVLQLEEINIYEIDNSKLNTPNEDNKAVDAIIETKLVSLDRNFKDTKDSEKVVLANKCKVDLTGRIDDMEEDPGDRDMKLHLEIHSANNKTVPAEFSGSDMHVDMLCDSDEQ